nr:SNF2 helicase associated domain-containing protein [Ruminiclostridium josui]
MMFKISKDTIYYLSTPMRYKKGMDYFRDKRIKSLSFNQEMLLFDATVLGTRPYNVQVRFTKSGGLTDFLCTCSDYEKTGKGCKHIAAVLFLVKEKDEQGFFNSIVHKKAAKDIFQFFSDKSSSVKIPVNVEFNLEFIGRRFSITKKGPLASLSLRIGTDRLYVVRNIRQLLESLKTGNEIVFGKGFTFDPVIHDFKESDKPVISYLQELLQNENLLYYFIGDSSKNSTFIDKDIFLSEAALKRLLQLLQDIPFNIINNNIKIKNVLIQNENIPLEFSLTGNASSIDLNINTKLPLYQITSDFEYFLHGETVYRVSEAQREYFKPFFNYMQQENTNRITFIEKDKERFFSEVLPYVEKTGQIYIDENVQEMVLRVDLEPEIYLDKFEDIITADVKFKYGDRIINPFSAFENQVPTGKILVRNMEKERIIIDILGESDFKVNGNRIYLDEEEKIFDFVNTIIPKLQEYAQIFYSDSFKAMTIRRLPSFSGFLRLNTLNNFLEFSFDMEGIDRAELSSIFQNVREKKKYFRLKNGAFLPLDSEGLITMSEIIDQLDLTWEDLDNELVQLPMYRAFFIDGMLKENGMKFFERNKAFKDLVHDIHEPPRLNFKFPKPLKEL